MHALNFIDRDTSLILEKSTCLRPVVLNPHVIPSPYTDIILYTIFKDAHTPSALKKIL